MGLRIAAKKDDCHVPLAKFFGRLGWVECDTSQLKKKADAFFAKRLTTICVEFKSEKGKLTVDEAEFKLRWERNGHYFIVRNEQDVLKVDRMFFGTV